VDDYRKAANGDERMELFEKAFKTVAENPSPMLALSSLTGSAAAFAAAALARSPREGTPGMVLVVTPGLVEADDLVADLAVLERSGTVRALEFPPPIEDDRSTTAARLKTAAAIGAYHLRPYPLVIVAPATALATPVPAAAAVAAATIHLALPATAETATPSFADLQTRLLAAGYERAPEVEAPGQFAVRGGVLDAWSPDDAAPIRAEFFGDDLESLRSFDPALQTSTGPLERAELAPVEIRGSDSEGAPTIADSLPPGSTLVFLEHNEYSSLVPPPEKLNAFPRVIFTGDPAPKGVPSADFQTSPLPGFAELGVEAARNPELLEAARSRLHAHIDAARKRGSLVCEDEDLGGGFEVPGLVVVTKSDRVFAHRRAAPRRAAASYTGERFTNTIDLDPGELVVHVDYGIGIFQGSTEIEVGGQRSEVFMIEYADGALLHVPTSHAHLLSRYVGVKGEQVKLHRLDGRRWAKEKEGAKRAVQDLAASLLETQARRAVIPGFAYDVEAEGVAEFEAAFPYEETEDQARAIADVKRDMAEPRPMDRLVCGDAGYGKTEVAMRAAFIAAMNGKQTAVLAPTTVLAEQHFETFTSRFDGTPIRIESVSRFQSDATHKGTFQRLATGACDIVIGTHAILSSKIAFRDLGLIIIDEEQRFGVRHKEFLKHLRATADVLTLSATPIPRTLYLSMTGARDLSLIRTPPRERVAVETKVVRDSAATVRAAVGAELARGGQVFFLHNRVSTIGKAEKRLNETCPEARVVVAHGQMDARTLARKMRDFERGKFDVLLSTTIVESGIDIPRANTIIVDHAEMFGLADLYQLRGRVGRSSREGHAYFLLPAEGLVDSDARERLSALQRHGALGSGFNLAVRDLELRGAGNLLGSQQSGHIAAVGFGLYCQLLQRTIAMMKGEKVQDIVEVKLHLDFIDYSPASEDDASAAALPYSYVEEDVQRMSFMKRFAEATDEKVVVALASELRDRFGPLPPAAKRLVALAKLRVACAAAKISNIDAKDRRAVFYKVGSRDVAFVRDLKGKTPDRKIAELISFASRQDGGSPS
jgi:transcription-repair coupling factor (superfamily II helicase)